jgi:beta-glucosidase
MTFPTDFVWGAATASYQIEGAVHEDGRSESIWDRFAATPGKVHNGHSGDIADDHYHRYREDVALLRSLGLRGYRFSVAWPRIIPGGTGDVNPAGLDFYDRLVDELLRNGIEPYVTLYHWDLPQVLQDRFGGWLDRSIIDAFAEYALPVVRRLGDRVRYWITHNEPQVVADLGYAWGAHAPGLHEGIAGGLIATHNLLVSHGRAVEVIRSEAPGAQVGITLNLNHVYPSAPSDAEAVQQADMMQNRRFLDPIFRGRYPDDLHARLSDIMPPILPGDLELISQPIDFLGINYYSRAVVRSGENGRVVHVRPEGSQYTDMDWEVYPQGLYDLLTRVHRDYKPPAMYVTENGSAYPDVRTHEGAVNDPERRDYLRQHLQMVGRAAQDGVPMRGYFAWSFLDNFEWAYGYSKRFGLVYVDYPTLERIPKESARWYRDFILSQTGNVRDRVPS